MGRKHREKRGRIKAELRLRGWRENEFGELCRVMSKAEARRTLLARHHARIRIQNEILDRAAKLAHDEICAIEDARVFAALDLATKVEGL